MSESDSSTTRKGGLRPGSMTQAHKEALAAGRNRTRIVRAYLDALEKNPTRRGPRRTLEKVRRELAEVANAMVEADTLQRLELVQKRITLQKEVADMEKATDISALEAEFIGVARDYSESKNPAISHEAWRAMGVPARVLKAAGITESAAPSAD